MDRISDSYAKDAYIYAYSMDEAYKYLYNTTISRQIPLNEFQLITSLADDSYTDHPTINNDTLHLMGWLDVKAEPVIVTVPDADEGRYWILHTMDLGHYTDSMFGSRTRGPKGGKFLYASYDWDGKVPDDIDEVVRVQSDIVKVMGRVMAIDAPGDIEKARALQSKWKLETLSQHQGKPKLPIAKRDYPDPDKTNWLERVNFVLGQGHMAVADKQWLDKCEKIGLTPDNQRFTPEQLDAAKVGEKLGMEHIIKIAPEQKDARKLLGTRKQLENDPRDLFAEGTYLGQWGLPPEESMYYQIRSASDGKNINGSHRKSYRIRMKKPDVSQFWSITAYRTDNRLMAHNAINRHSRGDRTLTPDDDGYYVMDLSADVDGNRDNPNFLPIPDADTYLIVRMYGPDQNMLEGNYQVPVVEVVRETADDPA